MGKSKADSFVWTNDGTILQVEAEDPSPSVTIPNECQTSAFDWLNDQTGSHQGALQIYLKHSCKSLL